MNMIDHFTERGLTLKMDGDQLSVRPKERITDEVRAFIRGNKAEILEAMSGNAPSQPDQPSGQPTLPEEGAKCFKTQNPGLASDLGPELNPGELVRVASSIFGGLEVIAIKRKGLDGGRPADIPRPKKCEVVYLNSIEKEATPPGDIVQCCDCQHFRPDDVRPESRIGSCGGGVWTFEMQLPYPKLHRRCEAFISKSFTGEKTLPEEVNLPAAPETGIMNDPRMVIWNSPLFGELEAPLLERYEKTFVLRHPLTDEIVELPNGWLVSMDERSAILEYDGGMSRKDADRQAGREFFEMFRKGGAQ